VQRSGGSSFDTAELPERDGPLVVLPASP
jgi:hypothetical protein